MIGNRNRLPLKQGFVSRPRLDAFYQKGMDHHLVTVTAASGYGKTVTTAAFAQKTNRRLAWLSIGKLDNDPAIFWNDFIHSLTIELPHLADKLAKLNFPGTSDQLECFLRTLAKAVYNEPSLMIVADNFNNLENEEVICFFRSLIELNLKNLCLIVISNDRNNVSFADFKFEGEPFRINQDHLCFTVEETCDLFQFYGTELSSVDAARVIEATEGWPLALYLINLHCQDERSLSQALHLNFEFITELFESQYFLHYDKDIRYLLIKLSLLPNFSLEIAADIGCADLPKAADAITANMLITYDYDTDIFRYQKIYRDFLSHKQYLLTQAEKSRIYAIAGDWHHRHGRIKEAIEYYWQSKSYDLLLQTMETNPQFRFSADYVAQILIYLEQLPFSYVKDNAFVDFAKAFMYLGNMKIHVAHDIFVHLTDKLEAGPADKEHEYLLGETYIALSDIGKLYNEDSFLDYMKLAYRYLPEGSRIYTSDLMTVENNDIFFLPSNKPGQLDHIIRCFQEYAFYANQVMHCRGYGYEHLFEAEAAYLTYQFDQARACCQMAMEKAREKKQHDIMLNAYHILIRIAEFTGTYKDMLGQMECLTSYLADITDIASQDWGRLCEIRDCIESWLYLRLQDYSKIPRWVRDNQCDHYRLLPVGDGRNKMMRVYYLVSVQKYHEALASLTRIENILGQKSMWTIQLISHIIKAECLLQTGSQEAALYSFWQAYDMSHQNGIITPFIEFGGAMHALIESARKTPNYTFAEEWLDSISEKLTCFRKKSAKIINSYNRHTKTNNHILKTKLTPRENEVLHHLAKGMTRNEIAEQLDISTSAIKKHVTGIYNKLGAINRADAIYIAALRGDLEPAEDSGQMYPKTDVLQ